MKAKILLLYLLTGLAVPMLSAQLSYWGRNKEQVVKGVFAQYGDQTIFFEWRRQIKDDYPKSTIMMLRSDTTLIRSPFSIDERSLKTSIEIPSLIQVLYLQKGGPGPDDFKPTPEGMMVKWMELPIEDEVTGTYADIWRFVPGKGYLRDSSSGFQIVDVSNMGHLRDTIRASATRYYASGAKWIEKSWSTKVDSMGFRREKEMAWLENGKPQMERTFIKKAGADTTLLKGWHPSGGDAFQMRLLNGKLDGPLVRWHANGNKAEEGSYKNGMRVGLWKTYFPDGKPMVEWEYDPLLPDAAGRSSRQLVSAWDETGERTATSGKGELKVSYTSVNGCKVTVTETYKAGKKVDEGEKQEDCSGTSDFPGIEYQYIRAYRQGDPYLAWDPDYDQAWVFAHGNSASHFDYYTGMLMHPHFRGEGKQLSKTQAASLLKALNAPSSFEEAQGGDKAEPSMLFVFYDMDHVPVAFCGVSMNVQRAVSSPVLSALEPPLNMVMSALGYKAFGKLCSELWPGEDGLCDPLGFLPTEAGNK